MSAALRLVRNDDGDSGDLPSPEAWEIQVMGTPPVWVKKPSGPPGRDYTVLIISMESSHTI